MDKDQRSAIERATQRARQLLEDDFAAQLEGSFDILRDGHVGAKAGAHLSPRQVAQRDKIVAAIEHKRGSGRSNAEAVADYLRDAAFTTLNRFVALKMLEARELVQECITKGESCSVPEDLRAWLAREFFPLHLKMYSKSRRKAPIYWQLATTSGSYSVWLYLHAFTKDTLYTVQRDYVVPKLEHEERALAALRKECGDAPKAADRKRLTTQEAFVEELRTMLDEVKRIAPLWNPNLDDGVIINHAPLWRLVSPFKPWQKELKATWDALAKGDYDWAHLSMHLWPERVVPKCATDRSLAIAHGIEDVFWVEGADGKWKARAKPTKSVEELVRERTSAAVKAALDSLVQAGSSGGTVGRKAVTGKTRGGK